LVGTMPTSLSPENIFDLCRFTMLHSCAFLHNVDDLKRCHNVTQLNQRKTTVSVLNRNRKHAYTKEVSCVYRPILLVALFIHSFIYLFQTTEVHRHIHKNICYHSCDLIRSTHYNTLACRPTWCLVISKKTRDILGTLPFPQFTGC